MDALRYLVMTLPEPEGKKVDPTAGMDQLSRARHKELEQLRRPRTSGDPFGGL